MSDIRDWQRRFFAAPKVWWIVDGRKFPLSSYAGRSGPPPPAGAAWVRRAGGRDLAKTDIRCRSLARERWNPAGPIPAAETAPAERKEP